MSRIRLLSRAPGDRVHHEAARGRPCVGGTVAPSGHSGTISAPSSAVARAAALQRARRTMTRGKHREPVQRDLSCPTTTATSLAGFIREVETIIQRWTPPRVDWYISPWFRGHSNVEWELDPGWYRQAAPGRKKGDAWYSEHNLLLEFKLRAPRYLPAQPATDWHWLFVMQHYGLPCPSPKLDRQNDIDFQQPGGNNQRTCPRSYSVGFD